MKYTEEQQRKLDELNRIAEEFFQCGMEQYNPIEGYPDYEISQHGVVRKISTNFRPKIHLNAWGYPAVNLTSPHPLAKTIHRMLLKACVPNPNNYDQINHIDGEKTNYSLSNLEWCNQSMNQRHAYDNGLNHGLLGEANPKAKLTEYDVKLIRRMSKLGIVQRLIAQVFGMAEDNIHKAVTGKYWGHVPEETQW